MGIGVSLLLIAGGAILAWAVNKSPSGIDVNAIGVILLIVGVIGLVLSMIFWSTWWGPGYFRRRYTTVGPRRAVRPAAYDRGAGYEEIEEERF
jgi:hypothetical protein